MMMAFLFGSHVMKRAEYLHEMGLGPLWVSRSAAELLPVEAPASAPVEDLAESGAYGALPATAVPLVTSAAQPLLRRDDVAALDFTGLNAAIRACTACGLSRTRTQAVPGVGAQRADWLLVGEAPGAEEDQRGEPFVGQAGKLLDNMLAAIGLQRGNNVYIANVLKCRPPSNRNPSPEEIVQCRPFLHRQIALLQPRIIVALGKFAAQTLLDTDAPIGTLRGRLHRYEGVPLVCTYHPAYLLRSLGEKSKAWDDLCLARRTLVETLA